jgi:hypothetical protein
VTCAPTPARSPREPLPLTRFRVDTLVVDARRPNRHRTRGGQHLAFAVIPVAHHQPIPVLVDQIGEPLDVGGDLRLQRGREHLPGSIANNLIQQRTTRIALIGRIRVVNYREHGRTFPTSASTPVLIEYLFP